MSARGRPESLDAYVVLTDHGDPEHFQGVRERIDPQWSWLETGFLRGRMKFLRSGIRGLGMYLRSLRYPSRAVIVTYGASHGFVLAVLQHSFRHIREPRVHLMFDLLLDRPRSGWARFRDTAKAWIFNRAIDGAVVWGKSDVDLFARAHGLDRRKLRFHPYHITLDDFGGVVWEPGDGGYVFCGGNVGRDFETVIEALGPTGIPVVIATQVEGVAQVAARYPSITVRGVTPVEFRHLLASSTVVVEAHPAGFFRTAGHQTMLNALYLGKPVVVCDRRSAAAYVRDGVDGYVLDCGDRAGLQKAVIALWTRPDLRAKMERRARAKASRPLYSTLGHMQSVYDLAMRLDRRKRGEASFRSTG
ncbi:MAG: glycosyltransferase [Candidatus Krumholzibacteriia bacterium]